MKIIGKLSKVSGMRTLQGSTGDVKVVDVVISDGCDTFVASAFDKVAEKFSGENAIKEGSIIVAQATANARDGKEGKVFQSIKIDQISCFARVIEAF